MENGRSLVPKDAVGRLSDRGSTCGVSEVLEDVRALWILCVSTMEKKQRGDLRRTTFDGCHVEAHRGVNGCEKSAGVEARWARRKGWEHLQEKEVEMGKILRLSVCLVVAMCATLIARPVDAATMVLSGTVTNASGSPISGATVTVAQHADYDNDSKYDIYSAQTDSSGSFSISVRGSASHMWDVYIVAPGFAPYFGSGEYRLDLDGLAPTAMAFPLKQSSGYTPVTVTVKDEPGGSTLPGARLQLDLTRAMYLGVTDSSGQAVVLVPSGVEEYVVSVDHPARPRLATGFDLSGTPPYSVTIYAGGSAQSFSGTAKTTDGSSVQIGVAEMEFVDTSTGDVYASTMGGASNPADFQVRLPEGDYKVVLHNEDHVYAADATVDATTIDPLDITFDEETESLSSIEGSVLQVDTSTGDEDLPVEGADVLLLRILENRVFPFSETDTDTNGEFSFSDLPEGDYEVVLEPYSPQVSTTRVTLGYSESLVLDAMFPGMSGSEASEAASEGSLTISGTVVDESSSAIENLVVTLHDGGSGELLGETETDSNGDYSFSGLGDGTYMVSVAPEEVGSEILFALEGAVTIELTGSNTTLSDIVMYAGNAIYVSAFTIDASEEAEYLQSATVTISQNGQEVARASTDAHGFATFGSLSIGTYDVEVSKSGCVTKQVEVTISSTSLLGSKIHYAHIGVGLESE